MYKHVQQNGCGDLFLDLLEYDDEKKILVMERGMCNLKEFAQLRRMEGNPDGPINAKEVMLIIEYISNAM